MSRSCQHREPLDAGFKPGLAMAFQPVVDVVRDAVFGHEAFLLDWVDGHATASLLHLSRIQDVSFANSCRRLALELAARKNLDGVLCLGFATGAAPDGRASPSDLMELARTLGYPLDRLLFAITERVLPAEHTRRQASFDDLRGRGLKTAVDQFGSGYAGLLMLAAFQPEFVKLDADLVRGIDQDRVRQAILAGVTTTCRQLHIDIIANGVTTSAELKYLRAAGVRLFQGAVVTPPCPDCLTSPKTPSTNPVSSGGPNG